MNRYKLCSILTLGCLIICIANVAAQQSETGKSRAPRLTSDDVARSRTSGTVVVLNAIDPNRWAKHNPAGLRLSVELPGGIDPHEVDLPDYALNAPHEEYLDAKLYVGKSTALQVNMLYIPSKKLSVTEAELRKAAAAFVKAFSTKMDPKARYSALFTGKSTVTVKAFMIS